MFIDIDNVIVNIGFTGKIHIDKVVTNLLQRVSNLSYCSFESALTFRPPAVRDCVWDEIFS